MKPNFKNSRRKFIGTLATGATAGISGISSPLFAGTTMDTTSAIDADAWMDNIKGSHRVVYDAPEPHAGFPFIWSWVYYKTNNQTGINDNDMTAMVVLRHNAIPFALKDQLWKKYGFGELFGVVDNTTGVSALRNPYYQPKEGDYPMPGIEGIKQLQSRGAMFCVCEMALTVYSGMAAQQMELKPEEVKEEWVNGVLPGIQIVPSGVWALTRAQKKDCGYIYAGG